MLGAAMNPVIGLQSRGHVCYLIENVSNSLNTNKKKRFADHGLCCAPHIISIVVNVVPYIYFCQNIYSALRLSADEGKKHWQQNNNDICAVDQLRLLYHVSQMPKDIQTAIIQGVEATRPSYHIYNTCYCVYTLTQLNTNAIKVGPPIYTLSYIFICTIEFYRK